MNTPIFDSLLLENLFSPEFQEEFSSDPVWDRLCQEYIRAWGFLPGDHIEWSSADPFPHVKRGMVNSVYLGPHGRVEFYIVIDEEDPDLTHPLLKPNRGIRLSDAIR